MPSLPASARMTLISFEVSRLFAVHGPRDSVVEVWEVTPLVAGLRSHAHEGGGTLGEGFWADAVVPVPLHASACASAAITKPS